MKVIVLVIAMVAGAAIQQEECSIEAKVEQFSQVQI